MVRPGPSSTDTAISAIKAVLGPKGWLEMPEDTLAFRRDWNGGVTGETPLVARPDSVAGVVETVRLAGAAGLPIVPQGGNTSVSAGGVPGSRPALILSLARLNRIRAISAEGYTITCDAGVTLQAAQTAAAEADRLLALDLGARGSCTVGGCVATNAGGLNTLRYGNAREQVLGLEVVLPNGTVWDGLRRLRKDNTGYDLKQLFIGAEGTLGVITGVVMRLQPRPTHHVSAFMSLAALDQLPNLLATVRDAAGERVDAVELCPEALVDAASRKVEDVRRPLATRAAYYVLIRLAGMEPMEPHAVAVLDTAWQAGTITDGMVAQSGAQEAMLWSLREHALPKLLFEGPMVKCDAATPIEHTAALIARLTEGLDRWPGAWLYSVGHVGDGNQHINVIGASQDASEEILSFVEETVWSFGGTISAEHGIGHLFRKSFERQKSPVELAMMRQLKASFDPGNIMNPGIFFE